MKIAHFCVYGPGRCGMYESTRDLAAQEMALGHDAKLIDTGWITDEKPEPTTFKFDRGVDVATNEWAAEADVHVLHSQIPDKLFGKKPVVMMLHGLPEYLFYSEVFEGKNGDGTFTTLLIYRDRPQVQYFITMWNRHVPYWQSIYGDDRVRCIPPVLDAARFSPEGEKETLVREAKFNVGYCDNWRPTCFKEPFQVIPGMREYWKKYDDARLHIFGIPSEHKRGKVYGKTWDRNLLAVQQHGDFMGGIWELHADMPKVYRALDVVVTVSMEETRIVREALASGTPLIAPVGNPCTEYTCPIGDPYALSETIGRVRTDLEADPEGVKKKCLESFAQMGTDKSAAKLVEILESIT